MDKRKILVTIIAMIILIIFILIALIVLNEKNANNNTVGNNSLNNILNTDNSISNSYSNNIIEEETPSNEISHNDKNMLEVTKDYFNVKIDSVYFAIRNKAEDFFNTINNLDKNDSNKDKLYNILSKEYINKSGITKQNLSTTFSKYSNSEIHVERIIEKIEKNNICIFIVYGTLNEKEEYNMAVITDETNMSYCVYPYEYLQQNGINGFNQLTVAKNQYNNLEYKDIKKEDMVKYHLEDYKYYAQNNPEKLYNKLNPEYSQKRFGSLENFKEYINDNKVLTSISFLKSYKVTRNDDVLQYDCIDNFGNHYTFKETDIMQYTLILDNYTLMSEKEIEDYNKMDNKEKAKYNLVKFINMVNSKDYKGIYNVLDNTFKNNNFKDVNSLKQYLKKNMYELNSIELEDINDDYGYYIFECEITNNQNNKEKKDITVIIDIKEGTNFTMSFNTK